VIHHINSILLQTKSDAYKFMRAIQDLGRELIGVLTVNQKTNEKGVLILP